MTNPVFSIAIATFNSEKTLRKTLDSIKKQNYPYDKIETLIIDGGSTDNTLSIAKNYHCKIISNPKRELIFAKHIGFLKASGKYLIFLDSDEVLDNPNSLQIKYTVLQQYPKIKGLMPTGYKTPANYSFINSYVNEVGDPFSFFNYRLSQDARFYIKLLSNRYPYVLDDENAIIFNFSSIKPLPIIELMAGGGLIDLNYMKKTFPEIKSNTSLIAFFFYLLIKKKSLIGITKNDRVIHYSSASLTQYLAKIRSRIKNNTFETTMGKGGFLGRQRYQPLLFRLKKYLFIPYSFTLIFPLIDACYFSITRKKLLYFIHIPLCFYTSILILYFQIIKLLGINPKINTYGK